jgi:hypothetical protein
VEPFDGRPGSGHYPGKVQLIQHARIFVAAVMGLSLHREKARTQLPESIVFRIRHSIPPDSGGVNRGQYLGNSSFKLNCHSERSEESWIAHDARARTSTDLTTILHFVQEDIGVPATIPSRLPVPNRH